MLPIKIYYRYKAVHPFLQALGIINKVYTLIFVFNIKVVSYLYWCFMGVKKIRLETESPAEKLIPKAGRYVGAHVSGAGGLYNSFAYSQKIGGRAMALFLKNQRKWEAPKLSQKDIEVFVTTQKLHNFDSEKILPHGSYLINLGNPDEEKRKKSYISFIDDLKRCDELGIVLYNLHPGSTVGLCSVKDSIKYISNAINEAHKEVKNVCVVLETMAGQGNTVGSKFEELKEIIELVFEKSRVGVCIDTCHIFAAGYDIRTKDSYKKTMQQFDSIVGFKFLRGVHLNDSKADLGSGKDRHENIGKGKIGLDAFKNLMNDDRFKNIPLILETPVAAGEDEHNIYSKEIELLYSLVENQDN